MRRDLDTYIPQHHNIGENKNNSASFWKKNNKKLFLSLPEKSVHCGNVRGLEGKAANIFPDDTMIE